MMYVKLEFLSAVLTGMFLGMLILGWGVLSSFEKVVLSISVLFGSISFRHFYATSLTMYLKAFATMPISITSFFKGEGNDSNTTDKGV